jgi:ATP-dependent DNA helicase RecG
MAHPDVDILRGDETGAHGIAPRYPEIPGISARTVERAVRSAVALGLPHVTERLPEPVRAAHRLSTLVSAVRALHEPPNDLTASDLAAWNEGRTEHHARMAFEEFFLLEAALALRRSVEDEVPAEPLRPPPAPVARARDALPFELTRAQTRVVAEVEADLVTPRPMRRLLQGDVGSGKTAVAMLAAAHAVAAGAQVAFMAPTEVLAEQHFRSFAPLCTALGLRHTLDVGGARASHRRKVQKGLEDGTIDVAVGTHALLTEGVRFRRLRLVIVDEQHRFGVGQRLRLVQKGSEDERAVAPHLLVMTATPIPRSLALVLYGDLTASVIDELPPGRLPPVTRAYPQDEREQAIRQLRRALDSGGQAYVICPAVEPSEDHDMTTAVEVHAELSQRFPEPVALMHGRLSPDDRRDAMERFASGSARVLVATTVVEVGVDVGAANAILVHDAERFGLAQLHQLRGRVGRRGQRSACLLVHRARSDEAHERLRVMCDTSDGFKLAEEDLRLRGPGELFGHRQSGLPGFRFGDLRRDLPLLATARECAREVLASDPQLARTEHQALLRAVQRLDESVVREEAG